MFQVSRRVCRLIPFSLIFAAFVVSAVTPVTMHAQTSAAASVGGVVLDPDGKAVVEAAVIARNEATGSTAATVTDGRGHFSVTGLQSGTYTIEIAVPGFEIVRRTDVQATDRPEDINVRLSVANITETVTVSTALPAAAVAAPSRRHR